MYTLLDAEKDFKLILQNIKENGEIKVHHSISNVQSIYKEVDDREDIPRTAFNLMTMTLFAQENNIDNFARDKINNVINFIYMNKEKGNDIDCFFTNLYLLKSLIYLKKDKQEILNQFDFFLKIIVAIKNKYNKPLLANKLISFYEEYKSVYNLKSLEINVANLKSVMLYLISSDLSKKYPSFYFADMLIWSKGECFHQKVLDFFEKKIILLDYNTTSSSALSYILECKLRAGYGLDKNLFKKIKRSQISLEKYSEIIKKITPGLFLNIPNESAICLDTNAHLLFGFLNNHKL